MRKVHSCEATSPSRRLQLITGASERAGPAHLCIFARLGVDEARGDVAHLPLYCKTEHRNMH